MRAATAESVDDRALRLHKAAIIVDGHNDIPSVLLAKATDLAEPDGNTRSIVRR